MTMPITYIEKATNIAYSGKNIPENKIYIGSLALHDINGVTKIVRNLSFGSSKALDAIIAGTEQPNPNNKGINALPDKPILPITESIT